MRQKTMDRQQIVFQFMQNKIETKLQNSLDVLNRIQCSYIFFIQESKVFYSISRSSP